MSNHESIRKLWIVMPLSAFLFIIPSTAIFIRKYHHHRKDKKKKLNLVIKHEDNSSNEWI